MQGAKLLDFGLAKSGDAVDGSRRLTMVPTADKSLTAEGTILGTFQYMAPEQLEGDRGRRAHGHLRVRRAAVRDGDRDSQAFDGKSQASLIASIINANPAPIASFVPVTPPALERLVRICLMKDPDERWQTAHDVATQLRWIAEGGSQVGSPAPVVAHRKSRERIAWALAAVCGVAAIAAAARILLHTDAAPQPIRFTVVSPPGVVLSFPRLSPDGRTIAFVGAAAARNRVSIWIRSVDSFDVRELEGTEAVRRPFWSPDSKYLAYFAGTQLKKVSIAGGPPQLIATHPGGADGSWGSQNVIVFDGRPTDPIWRVSAGGGSVTVAMKPDSTRKEVGVAWPYFLPDGKHFVFSGNSPEGPISLRVGALDEEGSTFLSDLQSRVEYSSGYLVYVSQNTMVARPFSTKMRTFTGDPFPVTDRIEIGSLGLVDFSLSQTGDLAYITQAAELKSRLLWTNRAGQELGTVGDPSVFGDIALAPDGSRVAASVTSKAGPKSSTNIWVYDVRRGAASRLTFGERTQASPVWSPDGTKTAYAELAESGVYQLRMKLASGAGRDEAFPEDKDHHVVPTDWSRDGHLVVSLFSRAINNTVIAISDPGHPGQMTPFLEPPQGIIAQLGRLSPDGKWIAYTSNESNRNEVYVQPYPPTGGRWQISTAGGSAPTWRGDGREIVYDTPGDTFYAVSVEAKGATLEVGTPVKLFQRTLVHGQPQVYRYAIDRDGQRFLLNTPVDNATPQTAQVVLNWAATLRSQQ